MKNGKAEIKIEKGISIPEGKWAKPNPLILVMKKMKKGDSFLYPLIKRTSLNFCARKAKIVIATRAVDDLNVRCWRVQ